ncbi:MAG TPA: tetratricopeptide repeat protein [Thermoanaerobaculia bacterium]|nr:tetratricopeptide repeat protein [Thermoanaerobaculia bacterium]
MTDWLSASAMLLAGVIVGAMFLYGMRRRQGRSDLERADLEAKRDALIARLREAPDPALEREAAEVLKKLDKMGVAAGASLAAGPARAPAPTHAALKGFLWGAGSVGAIAAIAFFVMQQSKPKEAAAAPADPLSDLERSVQQNPDNLPLRDDLAKAYLDRNNIDGVSEQTQYVLQRNPNDARALTYSAVVHIIARQPEAAAAMLQRATESDPNLVDAWVGVAWLNAQAGDMTRAEAAMAEAKRRHPEMAERLDQLMARLRGPSKEEAVHVTLHYSGQARGTIFIIARAAGVTAGPPAAVKRLALSAFPINVDLSASDSMMGQPLPQKMRIEARIDSDGDPMTHDPKDPAAVAEGVVLGKRVSLTLK